MNDPSLAGKKFDCDICGATVGGEWLETHTKWHEGNAENQKILLALASAVVALSEGEHKE